MKLDKSILEQLIQEALDEWTTEEYEARGGFASETERQGKVPVIQPVKDAEKSFIDSVLKHKYKDL